MACAFYTNNVYQLLVTLQVEQFEELDKELESCRLDITNAEKRRRRASSELANLEMDVTMRRHEINALEEKIQRLRDNYRFIENGWREEPVSDHVHPSTL